MNKDVQAFVYGSSMVSTIVALALFLRGRRDAAIFVGLWAPTVLSWAAFFHSDGGAPGAGKSDSAR